MPSLSPLYYLASVTGFVSGAFLYAGEPLWALLCGMAAVATGSWGRRRHQRPARGSSGGRISLWTAAALSHAAGTRAWRRQRAKFFLRALVRSRDTESWVNRLARSDAQPLWAAHPRLASKLQRPYLHCRWEVPARLEALSAHYDILRELFSPAVRTAIYQDGIALVRLSRPKGRVMELRLVYRDQFEKEGELSITLEDVETRLTLAGLTFCLTTGSDWRTAWIGGLQASGDPRTRELVSEVAKEMHGLRPKALVLWCLRQMCVSWQVDEIRAAADASHIYRHQHKRREFEAKYDEFWAESGGAVQVDGDWSLPLVVPPRPREEIKPSRRKAHELRYAMLGELRAELLAAYSTVTPEAAPEEMAALPRLFH